MQQSLGDEECDVCGKNHSTYLYEQVAHRGSTSMVTVLIQPEILC